MLLLREWYMHANGQIPAYEFAFDDVNPPVHAWACWRVYKMTGGRGERDRLFGGTGLWDELDGFYYDQLHADGVRTPLRVRSLVGVIPRFACELLEQETLDHLPGFMRRLNWFLENRSDLTRYVTLCDYTPGHEHRMLAIPTRERLERVLRYVLDEDELLAPHGIRSLSRAHLDHPYVLKVNGAEYRVDYAPGESTTGLFGGNSNWRGPIWFPLNYPLVEALERYHHFYGDDLRVECPVGSGCRLNLARTGRADAQMASVGRAREGP